MSLPRMSQLRLRFGLAALLVGVAVVAGLFAAYLPRIPRKIYVSYAKGSLAQFEAFKPMGCYGMIQIVYEHDQGSLLPGRSGTIRLEFVHRTPDDGSCADSADFVPFDRMTSEGSEQRADWLDYFLIDDQTETTAMEIDPAWNLSSVEVRDFAREHEVDDFTPAAFQAWMNERTGPQP